MGDVVWGMWYGGCGMGDVVWGMWYGGGGMGDVVWGGWYGGCGMWLLNSKIQEPSSKQIPMLKIQSSKHVFRDLELGIGVRNRKLFVYYGLSPDKVSRIES
jgi:hypothetical protein